MKKFDLNIKNVLFLIWNFVFTIMINCIFIFVLINWQWVWDQIHLAGLNTKDSGTMHLFWFLLLTWAKAMHLSLDLQCFRIFK